MTLSHEAGFPIWFVLALGAWSLVQAWRYRLGQVEAPALVGPLAATLVAGALATAWGVQLSLAGVAQLPDPTREHWVAYIGIKESLYNFDVAALLAIGATLLGTTGRRHANVASPA